MVIGIMRDINLLLFILLLEMKKKIIWTNATSCSLKNDKFSLRNQ